VYGPLATKYFKEPALTVNSDSGSSLDFDRADKKAEDGLRLRDEWLEDSAKRTILYNYQSLHDASDEAKALALIRIKQQTAEEELDEEETTERAAGSTSGGKKEWTPQQIAAGNLRWEQVREEFEAQTDPECGGRSLTTQPSAPCMMTARALGLDLKRFEAGGAQQKVDTNPNDGDNNTDLQSSSSSSSGNTEATTTVDHCQRPKRGTCQSKNTANRMKRQQLAFYTSGGDGTASIAVDSNSTSSSSSASSFDPTTNVAEDNSAAATANMESSTLRQPHTGSACQMFYDATESINSTLQQGHLDPLSGERGPVEREQGRAIIRILKNLHARARGETPPPLRMVLSGSPGNTKHNSTGAYTVYAFDASSSHTALLPHLPPYNQKEPERV
jgi:hypothetical protein